MKVMFPSKLFVLTAGLVLFVPMQYAQTSIQLFSAVNVRNSASSTTYSNLATFNSSTVNLTCPATGIIAKLSGPAMNLGRTAPQTDESGNLQPGGNLLVDNVLLVTDTPQGGSAHTPVNVCANAGGLQIFAYNGQIISQSPTDLTWNCFTSGYGNAAGSLVNLANPDPDTTIVPGGTQTVDAAGGVPPIDISSDLVPGQQNVNIALVDGGAYLPARRPSFRRIAPSTVSVPAPLGATQLTDRRDPRKPLRSTRTQAARPEFSLGTTLPGRCKRWIRIALPPRPFRRYRICLWTRLNFSRSILLVRPLLLRTALSTAVRCSPTV